MIENTSGPTKSVQILGTIYDLISELVTWFVKRNMKK